VIVGYGALFLLATLGLIRLGGGVERALPSLANLTLLAVPLVSLLVTVVFLGNARAFTEMLLAQPLGRGQLLAGLYLGLALPLVGLFLAGTGIPLALVGGVRALVGPALLLLVAGALLTATFTALGFAVVYTFDDATRSFAAALVLWLGLTVVYDGAVLAASQALAAYPLEKPMLVVMALNPVDLARVLMLMAVDASVLLGYTGAVFQDFFGSVWGITTALASMGIWIALPYALALRRFRRMDF
jgi:Cu-processing system permease protein